jgi:hypothetical protein
MIYKNNFEAKKMTYNNLWFKVHTILKLSNWSMRSIAFLETDQVFLQAVYYVDIRN